MNILFIGYLVQFWLYQSVKSEFWLPAISVISMEFWPHIKNQFTDICTEFNEEASEKVRIIINGFIRNTSKACNEREIIFKKQILRNFQWWSSYQQNTESVFIMSKFFRFRSFIVHLRQIHFFLFDTWLFVFD